MNHNTPVTQQSVPVRTPADWAWPAPSPQFQICLTTNATLPVPSGKQCHALESS